MSEASSTPPAVEASDGFHPVLMDRLTLALFFKANGSRREFGSSGMRHHYRLMACDLLLACKALDLSMTLLPQEAAPAGPGVSRDERQSIVAEWVARCWGKHVLASHAERGGRLLEEALELAQAAGLPRGKAEAILEYVYGRPVGDPAQEAGGVGVTLLALCASLGLSAEDCERQEAARVLAKPAKSHGDLRGVEHFRRRHAEKEAAGVMSRKRLRRFAVTQQEREP